MKDRIFKYPPKKENSLKDSLFYIEMASCSVSDKLVLNESKSPSTPATPNLPASLMPIEDDEEVPASPGSANSSDFSLISDFELMGGSTMERDNDARVALLTPPDLTAVISQLQIAAFCRDFIGHQHGQGLGMVILRIFKNQFFLISKV